MADERQGFLGRWARRKTDTLRGLVPPEPTLAEKPAPSVPASPDAIKTVAENTLPTGVNTANLPEKMLSLDDVKLLTGESDFKPFMASNVGPEVRNAAMKKLFTDPHYNVMDGLDTYIDDYSKSDPIPQAMLRQMVGAKLLKIFDDEDPEEDRKPDAESGPSPASREPLPSVNLNSPEPEGVAQSGAASDPTRQESLLADNPGQPNTLTACASLNDEHADPHLRLQPDHASSAPGAGRGAA